MIEKEKNETNPTEKKEHVFVLGIGKGPKMRTIEFLFTPVEKAEKKAEEEKAPQEEESADKKAE